MVNGEEGQVERSSKRRARARLPSSVNRAGSSLAQTSNAGRFDRKGKAKALPPPGAEVIVISDDEDIPGSADEDVISLYDD